MAGDASTSSVHRMGNGACCLASDTNYSGWSIDPPVGGVQNPPELQAPKRQQAVMQFTEQGIFSNHKNK